MRENYNGVKHIKDTNLIIEYLFISRDVDEYRYSRVPEEIFENVEKEI